MTDAHPRTCASDSCKLDQNCEYLAPGGSIPISCLMAALRNSLEPTKAQGRSQPQTTLNPEELAQQKPTPKFLSEPKTTPKPRDPEGHLQESQPMPQSEGLLGVQTQLRLETRLHPYSQSETSLHSHSQFQTQLQPQPYFHSQIHSQLQPQPQLQRQSQPQPKPQLYRPHFQPQIQPQPHLHPHLHYSQPQPRLPLHPQLHFSQHSQLYAQPQFHHPPSLPSLLSLAGLGQSPRVLGATHGGANLWGQGGAGRVESGQVYDGLSLIPTSDRDLTCTKAKKLYFLKAEDLKWISHITPVLGKRKGRWFSEKDVRAYAIRKFGIAGLNEKLQKRVKRELKKRKKEDCANTSHRNLTEEHGEKKRRTALSDLSSRVNVYANTGLFKHHHYSAKPSGVCIPTPNGATISTDQIREELRSILQKSIKLGNIRLEDEGIKASVLT